MLVKKNWLKKNSGYAFFLILGPKKFWAKKNFEPKWYWVQTFLCVKVYWVQQCAYIILERSLMPLRLNFIAAVNLDEQFKLYEPEKECNKLFFYQYCLLFELFLVCRVSGLNENNVNSAFPRFKIRRSMARVKVSKL